MQHGRVKQADMPLITITHPSGCGAQGSARSVAESLSGEVYDDSRLREKAFRMELPTEQLKGLREQSPGWFEHLLSSKPEKTQGREVDRVPIAAGHKTGYDIREAFRR
jgi:hypothetical protein